MSASHRATLRRIERRFRDRDAEAATIRRIKATVAALQREWFKDDPPDWLDDPDEQTDEARKEP